MQAIVRGALIPPDAGNPTLTQRLRKGLGEAVAAQADRWRLWSPVAFGAGCAIYFGLASEPPLWLLIAAAVAGLAGWLGAQGLKAPRGVIRVALLLALLATGLATAGLRTHAVAAPVAPALDEPVEVSGWVVDVDSPGERGARVVVAPVRIEGLALEETPHRLRATIRGAPPPPGAPVRLFAILNPPPAPASPGAYDFGRNAWFQGMGGVAFALGPVRPAILPPPPWRLRLTMAVNAARFALAQRIVARLGPRTGGVAAAMTTGHEAWISREDMDAMRDSGLAHILSISGLHMAIVGGFTFFAVRLGVAAWPWLALRTSGKKLAAWAGLAAVGLYLVVSGAPPAAERAAVTASIAFLAILLVRRAISMHALGVAAFVVLALQPEAVVTPGFQMSFAATAALVALAESWPVQVREISAPWPIVAIQRTGSWLVAACAASLVAGLATGPFAMQHFNRTAVFGLLANIATAPISSFLMMPALAIGAALEPFGLGGPFLAAAGWGVDLMLAVGTWTANLPWAVRTVPSAPGAALPVAFLGLLFICLWRGRLRWLGLPFAAAVLLWPRAPAPDIWIGDDGTNAAWRIERTAVVVRPGVRQFAVDLWSRRRGLEPAAPGEGILTCSGRGCGPALPGAAPVAVWWGKAAPLAAQLAQWCAAAEVISSRAELSDLPPDCATRLVLDASDYDRGGSVELWRSEAGWKAKWTAEARGDRPWSRSG